MDGNMGRNLLGTVIAGLEYLKPREESCFIITEEWEGKISVDLRRKIDGLVAPIHTKPLCFGCTEEACCENCQALLFLKRLTMGHEVVHSDAYDSDGADQLTQVVQLAFFTHTSAAND